MGVLSGIGERSGEEPAVGDAGGGDAEGGDATLVDPGLAEGRSQLVLFGGMGAFAVGSMLSEGRLVWAAVAIVVVAFALNTAGKLSHYRSLAVDRRDRLALSASWLALSATVCWLLFTYADARYGGGEGSFLYAGGAAGIGFALLHMAVQSKCLPGQEPDG